MIYYTQLHLCTVDMSQQLELDEQSKEIATINSHNCFSLITDCLLMSPLMVRYDPTKELTPRA